jgi:hypothetical protein
MHGAFDDKEPEPAKSRRDAELTLGTGTLLAIIFGLVLLCVLCFGLGYTVGHSSSQEPVAATQPADSPQTASQATGAPPKPSATGQTGAAAAAQIQGQGKRAMQRSQRLQTRMRLRVHGVLSLLRRAAHRRDSLKRGRLRPR